MTVSGKPVDPTLGLLFIVSQHLMPLFKVGTIDDRLAREMAVTAIEAYHPETRADYVNIARTIACSITSLALLGTTASPDMPPPEKIRTIGRAIALNRTADQSERTMTQRRRYHKANPPSEIPSLMPAPKPSTPEPATAEPQPDSVDAEIQAAIANVMQEYLSASTATATPEAKQPPTSRPTPNQPPQAFYKHQPPPNHSMGERRTG